MRTTRLLSFLVAAALTGIAGTQTASATVFHTVRRGETLTSIAATDGLSVSELAAANGLSPSGELATGRALVIPVRGAAPVESSTEPAGAPTTTEVAAPTAPASSAGGVVVARGETLSGLAAQYGTSVDALAAANGMSPNGLLLAGRTLNVPSGAATTASQTPTEVESGTGAEPEAEYVTPEEVGSLAESGDVSPALAEAVADQESGFNDAEVSRTGATGVMQIEPGTWRDLNRAGLDLSSDSATDNVRGGVALLHDLLGQTGGDESEAIAAYYQGLSSVQARGMYPSTRRYVASVLALQGRY